MSLSIKLSTNEVRRLADYVAKMGLVPERPKLYEILRVSEGDLMLILYSSNMLVYNDSAKAREVLDVVLERKREEPDFYIGSDEAGKGEWYGPLVVAGTCLSPSQARELRMAGVKDSKLLPSGSVFELAQKIRRTVRYRSLAIPPERYNRLYEELVQEGKNLNDMLAWAHSEVIGDLMSKVKAASIEVIIDRFDFKKMDSRLSTVFTRRSVDRQRVRVIQKFRGEIETPVAAASILAKSVFEREVDGLCRKYHLDLKSINPGDVQSEVLKEVAKANFKNVRSLLY